MNDSFCNNDTVDEDLGMSLPPAVYLVGNPSSFTHSFCCEIGKCAKNALLHPSHMCKGSRQIFLPILGFCPKEGGCTEQREAKKSNREEKEKYEKIFSNFEKRKRKGFHFSRFQKRKRNFLNDSPLSRRERVRDFIFSRFENEKFKIQILQI